MIKKTMLAACLAALAFAALPAFASATYPDPYLKDGEKVIENTKFTVKGSGSAVLATPGGLSVACFETGAVPAVTGEGEFTNEETGSVKFTFHDCHTIFNISCTTAGEPSGTITTTTLPFHLKTVDHGGVQTPGVLITPGEGETEHGGPHRWTASCSFAGKVVAGGNGLIGTITSPEEQVLSNTATIKFQSEKAGHQTHRTVTNDKGETVEYDQGLSINGGATETTSLDAETSLTFTEGMKPEIRTTK